MNFFREPPFNLPLNTVIVVRVTATNLKGESEPSQPNTQGGIVQNTPQTALVLTRGALTDATKIILDWKLLDS